LRPLPNGVVIYEDFLARLDTVPVPDVPRAEVIDEFYDAVIGGRPPLHSGEWALATVEVCLAMLRSAREHKEIKLKHQVRVLDPAEQGNGVRDRKRL
jgi:phthalate 4,5-cis-dihydrodiol dehydrogenase